MGMKVLVTGGGTAGHINPALAIAGYARDNIKDCSLLYVGTPNGMEASLVEKAGFNFTGLKVKGFRRSLSPSGISHNVSAVMMAIKAKSSAKKILNDFKPDVVIGTGGYVCGPIVLAAANMGIKTAVHESNAFPGVTNKVLAKKVDYVFLSTQAAKKRIVATANSFVVGNPIRDSILSITKQSARKSLNISDDKVCIFSVGGSLGADSINIAAADIMKWHIDEKLHNIVHIHGYGRLGKDKWPQLLKERNIDLSMAEHNNITASEYIHNIDQCLAAADIVVCRCGALTISELQVLGKAAILIPSPNVTENHQFHNGMVMVEANASIMIQEKDYSKSVMCDTINSLIRSSSNIQKLEENALSLAITDTAQRIFDIMDIK